MASDSVTLPKYTWVVFRSWCRRRTLEIISRGTPFRLACVAEYLLGISRPHLSWWETGKYKPSALYLRRLNQFLSLDPLALRVYVKGTGLQPSPLNPLGDAGKDWLCFREWERRARGGY